MVSINIARAALPENGLTKAVGRASTKRWSQPICSTPKRIICSKNSKAPEARNTPTAHSIATKYGSRFFATSIPSRAPSTNASYTGTRRQTPTNKNATINPNKTALPSTDDKAASAAEDRLANTAIVTPNSKPAPSKKRNTTGSSSFNR